MDLDWLDDFLALSATQSFSRAAEARHVTQPAFSRRIQMLEKWVGAPLFERTPRRALLTPAGERFLALVETIPRDLRHARSAAQEAAGRSAKALTIAATHALSFSFFPGWARQHLAMADLGAVNLLSDTMAACEDMLIAGDASFLLGHRHPADKGRLATARFRHALVGADVLVPVVAPGADGAPRWRIRAGSTDPVPYLGYAPQSGLGRILKADWAGRGLALNLETAMTARLAAALLSMAREGRGVAWLPLSLAQDSLENGRLLPASEDPALATPVEIVLYRPVARLGAAAETFWNVIARESPNSRTPLKMPQARPNLRHQ